MHAEEIRKAVVEKLGREALEAAPYVEHYKWEHASGAPRECPKLPCGSFWGLVNNLRVLQQYVQLLSEAAGNRGVHASALYGGKDACKDGLEWFPCGDATQDHDVQEEYGEHVRIWRDANPGLFSYPEAAFLVHQGNAVEDRGMTKFVSRLLRPCCKEYEVDVAGNILRTRPSFDEFAHAFSNWREDAMYHTLVLAARNMPCSEQWAKGHSHEADEWQALLDDLNRTGFASRERLKGVCEALACRSPAFSSRVCSVLDRVAMQMRVRSSGGEESLDDCLERLQLYDGELPYAWYDLVSALQSSIPPSLMCPVLYPPATKGAWGFRRLNPGLREGKLVIETGPIAWMDRSELGAGGELPGRLHDILVRMGEAAMSPEMAHLMLDPLSLKAVIQGEQQPSVVRNYYNKTMVLEAMRNGGRQQLGDVIQCVNALSECLPVTLHRYLPTPMHVLGWRLDTPPKAIMYHGTENLRILHTQPHLLPKTLCADKVVKRTLSGISVLAEYVKSNAEDVHLATRGILAQEVIAKDFSQHPHNRMTLSLGVGDRRIVTTTTLAEALSYFTGPEPESVNEVFLHESMPWSQDRIDDRYAERQMAENGQRYRDWLVMYNDSDNLHRCRLASHSVTLTHLFETHFPMLGSECVYVAVASTLASEPRVLRHLGGATRLDVLRRSVENRFMNDSKLLPVRHAEDIVDRSSMELYSDPKSQQVMIVYAPRGSRQLELMSFRFT